MNDIIARMRCRTLLVNRGNGDVRDVPDEDCLEAAAEIERLRAEVQEQARINGMGAERELALQAKIPRLRKALGIIVDLCDDFDPPASLTASVARAALASEGMK